MKQLLAQVHGIQVAMAKGKARRHSQVVRAAAHHSNKPEAKQPAAPLVAKVRF